MFERRRSRSGLHIALLILFTAVITGTLIFFGIPKIAQGDKNPPVPNKLSYDDNKGVPNVSNAADNNMNDTIVTAASNKVLPAVVGISALALTKDKIFDSGGAGKWGIGSGVIVSQNGYIVTNNHVAGNKARILITLYDGNVVEGKTVWADEVLDLAIVKIDGQGYPVASLGDNNTLKIGDLAIAIGNPLGLQFQRTVTSGIISGLERTIAVNAPNGQNFMEDLIQTDALINPGNSGGPLLNSRGEVIGINTIKIQTAEGMGFAVPINIVKPIVNDFVQKGSHTSPHIGIFAYDRNVINYMDNGMNLDRGIYVATADQNGPASKAGINVGDVITHVDNIEVNTMMDLRTYMYNKGIGSTININYYSNGQPKTATVTLEPKTINDITR